MDRCETGQLHRGTITGWHVPAVRRRGFFCALGFRRRKNALRGKLLSRYETARGRNERGGREAGSSRTKSPVHLETRNTAINPLRCDLFSRSGKKKKALGSSKLTSNSVNIAREINKRFYTFPQRDLSRAFSRGRS